MTANARQRAIVDALAPRTAPMSSESLAEALGVSARTLYRDLIALRRAGVPILVRAGVGVRLVGDVADRSRRDGLVELEVTARGRELVKADPRLAVVPGDEASSLKVHGPREAVRDLALVAAGDVVVVGPDKLRREVRARARAAAKAHKNG